MADLAEYHVRFSRFPAYTTLVFVLIIVAVIGQGMGGGGNVLYLQAFAFVAAALHIFLSYPDRMIQHYQCEPLPLEFAQFRAKVLELCEEMGVWPLPSLWITKNGRIGEPFAFGTFFKSGLVFPAYCLSDLGVEDLAMMLRHELSHIEKGDPWKLYLSRTFLYLSLGFTFLTETLVLSGLVWVRNDPQGTISAYLLGHWVSTVDELRGFAAHLASPQTLELMKLEFQQTGALFVIRPSPSAQVMTIAFSAVGLLLIPIAIRAMVQLRELQADIQTACDGHRIRYIMALVALAFAAPPGDARKKASQPFWTSGTLRNLRRSLYRFSRSHLTAQQRLMYLQHPARVLYYSSVVGFLGGAIVQYANWTSLLQLRPYFADDVLAPYYLHMAVGFPVLAILNTPVLVEWAGQTALIVRVVLRHIVAYFVGALLTGIALAIPVYVGATVASPVLRSHIDYFLLVSEAMVQPAAVLILFLPLVFWGGLLLDLALKRSLLMRRSAKEFGMLSSTGTLLIALSFWLGLIAPGILLLTNQVGTHQAVKLNYVTSIIGVASLALCFIWIFRKATLRISCSVCGKELGPIARAPMICPNCGDGGQHWALTSYDPIRTYTDVVDAEPP